MVSVKEIAWAAGFLEGEGSFVGAYANGQITVAASQVQRKPLERLLAMFGGRVKHYTNKHGFGVHRWTVNGSYAIGVALTVFSFLSPRRREQATKMIQVWKSRPGRDNRLKTHCPRGHEYTAENIYYTAKPNGRRSRSCKQCYRTFYNQQAER